MSENEEYYVIPCAPWVDELFANGRAELPGGGNVTLEYRPSIDILHDELNEAQKIAISYLLLSGLGEGLALALSADNRNICMEIRTLTAHEKKIVEEAEKKRSDKESNFFSSELPPEDERLFVVSSGFDAQAFLKLFSALSAEKEWIDDDGEERSSSTWLFGGRWTFERENVCVHVIETRPTISEEWSLLEFLASYYERYMDICGFSDKIVVDEEFFNNVVLPAVNDWKEDYMESLNNKVSAEIKSWT